ncbi:MAG: DUF6580 family putative transport protein [Patescibacteria group bacterium]
MNKKTIIISTLLVITLGILGRILPHPWNFTPIVAIALFSSVYFSFRYGLAIFLVTMILSDVFIGFYEWQIMLAVYASFGVTCLIGYLVRQKKNIFTIIGGSLSGSILFYFLTNWAVWQFGTMYAKTFSGLMQSYTLALPFFKNMLLGDLFYTGLLFGLYELFVHYYKREELNNKILIGVNTHKK